MRRRSRCRPHRNCRATRDYPYGCGVRTGGCLHERARARRLPAASYASLVLRAHLQRVTPFPPDRELNALREAVAELRLIGRNLNQLRARGERDGQRDEWRGGGAASSATRVDGAARSRSGPRCVERSGAGRRGPTMRRPVDPRWAQPLLDIGSFGRRGPRAAPSVRRSWRPRPDRAANARSDAQGVRRCPHAQGVSSHLDHIGREGANVWRPTMARSSRDAERSTRCWKTGTWRRGAPSPRDRSLARGRTPKLVHNLVLSMPRGTLLEKLAAAVRQFAAQSFRRARSPLRYRRWHTDQAYAYVHLVVKAFAANAGSDTTFVKQTASLAGRVCAARCA